MATLYFDYIDGLQTNPGTSPASPKKELTTSIMLAGDTYLFKDGVTQINSAALQMEANVTLGTWNGSNATMSVQTSNAVTCGAGDTNVVHRNMSFITQPGSDRQYNVNGAGTVTWAVCDFNGERAGQLDTPGNVRILSTIGSMLMSRCTIRNCLDDNIFCQSVADMGFEYCNLFGNNGGTVLDPTTHSGDCIQIAGPTATGKLVVWHSRLEVGQNGKQCIIANTDPGVFTSFVNLLYNTAYAGSYGYNLNEVSDARITRNVMYSTDKSYQHSFDTSALVFLQNTPTAKIVGNAFYGEHVTEEVVYGHINSGPHDFINNYFIGGRAAQIIYDGSVSPVTLTAKNNIFENAVIVPTNVVKTSGSIITYVSSNNAFAKEMPGMLSINSVLYGTILAAQGAGYEIGSVAGNLKLAIDGRPLPGSKVIGAGAFLGIDRDVKGIQRLNPPCIGAYDVATFSRVLDSDPATW